MTVLQSAGLTEVLRARITALRPTLAICLGMQLLATTSAESPGSKAWGVGTLRWGPFPTP